MLDTSVNSHREPDRQTSPDRLSSQPTRARISPVEGSGLATIQEFPARLWRVSPFSTTAGGGESDEFDELWRDGGGVPGSHDELRIFCGGNETHRSL